MKIIKLLSFVVLFLFLGISACNENPIKPEVEPEKSFPINYKFINSNDSSILGGFNIHIAAYYPKVDSFSVLIGGLNNPAVGVHWKRTLEKEGFPGASMSMLFAAMKEWPEQWPNQDPPYQTYKWFYVEQCIIKDSTDATMNFVWPKDTARADVHVVDIDTLDPNFKFWGSKGTKEAC